MLRCLAIAAVLGAFLFGWPGVAENQQSGPHTANNKPDKQQRIVPPTHVVIDPPLPALTADDHPPQSKTPLQEKPLPRFVRPEWVIVYVTIAYAIIAWYTLRSIKRQADTMEKQLADAKSSGKHTETLASQAVKQSELTQLQMDLANRPWLCFDSIQISAPIRFSEDGACIVSFGYQIRNVGNSVAQHIQLRIEPMVSGVNMDLLKVRESVSNAMKIPATAHNHGKLVFPNSNTCRPPTDGHSARNN
jgi:hypothetical protein